MLQETIFQAIDREDSHLLELALKQLPDAGMVRNSAGETAIQYAAYRGKIGMVSTMLRTTSTLDLASACTIGDMAAVKTRVDSDPQSVHELSGDGFTPLCLAAAFRHPDILSLLLDSGADPNQRSSALGGVAPLDAAVFGRSHACGRILLDYGADPNTPQSGGFLPLHGACQNGDEEFITVLLANGARVDIPNEEGKLPIDFVPEGKEQSIRALFKPGRSSL